MPEEEYKGSRREYWCSQESVKCLHLFQRSHATILNPHLEYHQYILAGFSLIYMLQNGFGPYFGDGSWRAKFKGEVIHEFCKGNIMALPCLFLFYLLEKQ